MPALTALTYERVIKAYGQAGNVEMVWALWSEMIARGVTPLGTTFGRERLMDESLRQLVNTVIYSTILRGFAM